MNLSTFYVMKHAFTFALLAFTVSTYAQTEKGNSFIAGNISTGYSTIVYPAGSTTKLNNFSISSGITYGKFIKDNIAWQTEIGEYINRNAWKDNANGQNTILTDRNVTASLSTMGLYYFGKERWRGFVGGGINLSGSFYNRDSEGATNNQNLKDNSWQVAPVFKVGAVYFFNKRLALQAVATTNSFTIAGSASSAGLEYWIKPTTFEFEPKELATLQKGRWTLGLNFDVNMRRLNNDISSQTRTNEKRASVLLQLGKFVKDRTMVGVNLGYSANSTDQTPANTSQSTKNALRSYTGGVFLKQYLAPTRFTPYFRLDLNYTKSNQKIDYNTGIGTFHADTYECRPGMGLAYLISNHFLVETQLIDLYLYHIAERPIELKRWGGSLSAGLRPNLSLSYVF